MDVPLSTNTGDVLLLHKNLILVHHLLSPDLLLSSSILDIPGYVQRTFDPLVFVYGYQPDHNHHHCT